MARRLLPLFAAGLSLTHPQTPAASRPQGSKDVSLLQVRRDLGSAASVGGQPSDPELEVYRLLKELRRTGHSCPGATFPPNEGELLLDCRLWRAARLHSEDMGKRGYFGNTGPDGRGVWDRTKEEGLPALAHGVAAGVADPAGVLAQWKNNGEMCQQMMTPGFTRFAAGFASEPGSKYKHYWTMLFAQDTGAADAACQGVGAGGGGVPARRPGGDEPCTDSAKHCQQYKGQGHCDEGSELFPFMRDECPAACGFCGGEGSAPGSAPNGGGGECSDAAEHCQHYRGQGYCDEDSRSFGFMQDNCKATCGLCGASPVQAPVVGPGWAPSRGDGDACSDSDEECQYYKDEGYCVEGGKYFGFMRNECAATCGFCGAGSGRGDGAGAGTAPGRGSNKCSDLDERCQEYEGQGFCAEDSMFYPLMKDKCRAACGLCAAAL